VTLHAILVLPALAWLVSFADWSEESRVRVVTIGSVGYLLLVGVVSVQKASGLAPWNAGLAARAVCGRSIRVDDRGTRRDQGRPSQLYPGWCCAQMTHLNEKLQLNAAGTLVDACKGETRHEVSRSCAQSGA
jgi:hypothetical protein